MTSTALIPAWCVSALAFLAAWALWLVRPMPRLVRISLITPLVYFAALYLWVSLSPLAALTRTELVRLGMVLIFVSIILNAILVRWQWWKRGKYFDAH